MAAGRGRGAGAGAVRARIGGRAWRRVVRSVDGCGIAGLRRALRPAAGARLSARLAARLPARSRVGLDRARRGHRGGVGGGGAARPDRDRGLCGGGQPAGVGSLVVARAPGLTADGAGPAAQHAAGRSGDASGRSGGGEGRDAGEVDGFAGAGKIVGALEVDPELGGGAEELRQPHRGVDAQRGLALHQTLDPGARHVQAFGERNRAHAERFEIQLGEHLAGVRRVLQQRHLLPLQW